MMVCELEVHLLGCCHCTNSRTSGHSYAQLRAVVYSTFLSPTMVLKKRHACAIIDTTFDHSGAATLVLNGNCFSMTEAMSRGTYAVGDCLPLSPLHLCSDVHRFPRDRMIKRNLNTIRKTRS